MPKVERMVFINSRYPSASSSKDHTPGLRAGANSSFILSLLTCYLLSYSIKVDILAILCVYPGTIF